MSEKVSCGALIVCGGFRVPIDLAKMDNECGEIVQNAQQQIVVVNKMVKVTKAIEDTLKKLEPLWSAGTAAASMAGAYQQICGSLNDLNGQGEDLGKQIQAIGKLLETVNRIVTFVKGANAMCAALMSNPFSMSAAKACANATQVSTGTFLSSLTQFVNAVGQLVSAIQQSTQGTSNTVGQIGAQVGCDMNGMVPQQSYPYPAQTPPFVGQQPTIQPYPLPGQPQYPGATTPFFPDPAAGQMQAGYPSYPSSPASPLPASSIPTPSFPAQNGIPNVYDSLGWREAGSSTAGAAAAGTGEGLTIEITDSDGDGKHEVKVHVPEDQLDSNVTVTVDAKVGNEEIKGEFKVGK